MHYSCVSIPPVLAYSPDLAVLLSKLLKGSISFIIILIHSLQTILNITSISITTVILLHLWQVTGNLDHSSFNNLACSWSYSNVPKLRCVFPDHFFLCIKGPLKLSNDSIPSANFLHGRSDSLHMWLWARSNICHKTKSLKWWREDSTLNQSSGRGQIVEYPGPETNWGDPKSRFLLTLTRMTAENDARQLNSRTNCPKLPLVLKWTQTWWMIFSLQ